MNRLSEKHAGKLIVFVVYIAEAHASDEWPLGNFTNVKRHRTIADRLDAAKQMVARGLRLPLVCDSIDDSFDGKYACWPDRFYLLSPAGAGVYKVYRSGQATNEFGYDREQLDKDVKSLLEGQAAF
jgi:hypothetical protein